MPARITSALLAFSITAVAAADPLTTLTEIRTLPNAQAAMHLPVEVEGTVIYFDRNTNNIGDPEGLILNDGTVGCYASSTLPFGERDRIRCHLERIFIKLDAKDRTQAVTAAVQRGIVRIGDR